MRKQRPREVKSPVQGHKASKCRPLIPVYLAVIQFPHCRVRARRLWTGFKVVCGNCNWAEQGLRGSWRPAQASASFYRGSTVLAGTETQRMGLGEEGARGCKCMCVCVHTGIRVPLTVTAGQQTMAQIYPCSPLQGGGLAEEELPFCDFSRGSRRGSQALPTHTAQAAVDLAFSPRGRKSVQNHPFPTVFKSRGAQHSSQEDGAVLYSPRWSTALPGHSCKTLTAPATCSVTFTSHSILPTTPTDEESKAQRGWEICLRSHSREAAELGCKPRSGSLPQHHSTSAMVPSSDLPGCPCPCLWAAPHNNKPARVPRREGRGMCPLQEGGWLVALILTPPLHASPTNWYTSSPNKIPWKLHFPLEAFLDCSCFQGPLCSRPPLRLISCPLCPDPDSTRAHDTPVRGSSAHMTLCQGSEAAPLKC